MASGLLLALAFPSPGWFPLAWVGLVPFLVFLLQKPPWKSTLAAHLALCIAYFGSTLYWIPGVLTVYGRAGTDLALLIFGLMLLAMAVHPLMFTLAVRATAAHSRKAALVVAPAAWLASEILRNYLIVDGFPWAALGYSQYPYRCLIQIADLVGVYGVGWLIAAAASAVSAWIVLGWRRPLVCVVVLLALTHGYGLYRLYLWQPPEGRQLTVGLVQPNIAVSGSREYYAQAFFKRLTTLYERAAASGVDLVVFPEAPNPFYFQDDFYYSSFYRRLVSDYRTPLIFNGTAREGKGLYNSVFLLDAEGEPAGRYDKIHLVPFGEYLPYGSLLGFSRPLVRFVSGFTAGERGQALLAVEGVRLGLLICYEAIFPELSRAAVKAGAGLLVNLTNDLWFGDTAAPEQHLQMAAFRALEQRRYLVRAANSGYSGMIDPWGRIHHRSQLFRQQVLAINVKVIRERTAYSYVGDSPCFLIIIVSIWAAWAAAGRSLKRKSQTHPAAEA